MHWERVKCGIQPPEEKWKGNGGATVRLAKERLEAAIGRPIDDPANDSPTQPFPERSTR